MRKGFTLIEFLVVIVIVGILMAIAVPKSRELRACHGGKESEKCMAFKKKHSCLKKYKLSGGLIARCAYRSTRSCGVYLDRCDSGDTYDCQTNVTEMGE